MLFSKLTSFILLSGAQLAPIMGVSAMPSNAESLHPSVNNLSSASGGRQEVSFHFDNDAMNSLQWTFGAIEKVPEKVLKSGDAATNQWLAESGYKHGVAGKSAGRTEMAMVPSDWWHDVKCAGAIAAFIGTNVVSAAKILKIKKYLEALGGVTRAAKLLLKCSTWEERLRIGGGALVGLAAEILGVAAIKANCT